MKKINIAIGAIFITFSVFIFIMAGNFKQTLIVDTGLGADFFPKIMAVATVLLSGLLIFTSIRDKTLNSKVKEIFNSNIKKPLLGIALILAYGVSMMIFGYLISTIIFCYLFLHIFKVKNMLIKIAVSIIFSLAIYFIFNSLFLISLPTGFLI